MGWGTDFTCDIFLNRLKFANMGQIQDKIDELRNAVQTERERIMMLISATPRYIVPDEWNESPVEWLHNQADEALQAIRESELLISDLTRYLEVYDGKGSEEMQ